LKGQLAIETLADRKILGRPIFISEAMKKGKKKTPELKDKPVRQGPFGPKFRPDGGRPMGGRTGAAPRLGGAGGSRPTSSRNPRRGSGAVGGGFRSAPGASPSTGQNPGNPSGNFRAPGSLPRSGSQGPGAPKPSTPPPDPNRDPRPPFTNPNG
jgi:hypothetical protein